jgi:flagellum-specific peptidoglycan hydrolase FlgJ
VVKTTAQIFSLIFLISLVSCRAGRVPAKTAVISGTASSYIENYKELAISEMKRTGIPASITLAQGMLESDFGRSSLARVANNHFGIKCHNDWRGQTVRQHDDSRNECFRKYQRPEDSFYDHSDFLRSGSRYTSLFRLDPYDYKAWAHGLRRARYATP